MTGTWAQIGSPETVEILAHSGFDFLIIDTEHGYFGVEGAENLIRAADAVGVPVIVRVQDKNPTLIMKALDLGAQGILVPQVSTREDALRAVQAAKYGPEGNRGACPCVRAAGYLTDDWSAFARRSNEDTLVFLLVEGVDGVRNFEEIASVDGVDAIMVGPFDLSVALGVGGQMDHPLVMEKMEQMVRIAREKGVATVSVVFDPDLERMADKAAAWIRKGVRIVTVETDKIMLSHVFRLVAKALNQLRESESGGCDRCKAMRSWDGSSGS